MSLSFYETSKVDPKLRRRARPRISSSWQGLGVVRSESAAESATESRVCDLNPVRRNSWRRLHSFRQVATKAPGEAHVSPRAARLDLFPPCVIHSASARRIGVLLLLYDRHGYQRQSSGRVSILLTPIADSGQRSSNPPGSGQSEQRGRRADTLRPRSETARFQSWQS